MPLYAKGQHSQSRMGSRPGTLSIDTTSSKFQVLMELGSGGMGRADLAMSQGPQGFVKLVVLKSLKPELAGDDATYKMFLEEARISARLTHANLVQTYQVIERDRLPTMVLEYVEGQPLTSVAKALVREHRLDIFLTIITHVLAGLHAAHEMTDFDGTPLNLVHRDATPHNVMVQYDGRVKVLDFGIAKTTRSKVKTQIGIVKGKLRYMAPEQLVGDDLDRRADVFSVGIMFWEAITGTAFWQGASDSEIMRRLLSDDVWTPSKVEDVPEELTAIARRALAHQREDRYATAGEFHADLTDYLTRSGTLRSAEQIGNFVLTEFAKEREETNRIIESHIKAIDDSLRPPSSRTGPTRDYEVPTALAIRHGKGNANSTRRRVLLASVTGGSIVLAVAALMTRATIRTSSSKASTPAMVEAVPVVECGATAKNCGGQCVPFERPEFGCAASACRPCDIANATPRCNQRGTCDIAVCYQAYDDCDGDPTNGCETNVRIDPDHCGSCSHRCPDLPHATRGCGDVCTIWRCEAGYRDCNSEVADGCEVQVLGDPRNCGHCGNRCALGKQCRNGRCG